MIDIHTHILPGVDDGAQSMEEAVAMAEKAHEAGITTIVATPHHQNGSYINHRHSILPAVDELNETLKKKGIPITVLPGQETRIYGEMAEDSDELVPISGTGHYLFVEFPHDQVPRYATQLLYDLQMRGKKPIIVHPERNAAIQDEPDKLYQFVKNGALAQVTTDSLIGKFGSTVERFAHQLIEADLIHFAASDAHDAEVRGFSFARAWKKVEKQHGSSVTSGWEENARRLVEGQQVVGNPPQHVRKKKFLGLF
ncbi:tyrosine-protein phosphatase [Alkalicoccus urumqiensis]|uniref:Tyrosine-protein phosphatase n=1 Tax=Alkalicoccus urumqiensis TaxID=1548213 RepID=A0A2P6MHV3_ALKUR|nr:CpsB/CapC family capsule biosynthesis tyrosine phosphatase [Alkalicoccus urumqiensis]PRO65830.1 tyrosine protein phosphatase [Alkalicoccus urumqiensis]